MAIGHRYLYDGTITFCSCEETPNFSGTDLEPGMHSLHGCIAVGGHKKNEMNVENDYKQYDAQEYGGYPRFCFACQHKFKGVTCKRVLANHRKDKNMLVQLLSVTRQPHREAGCMMCVYKMDLIWTDDL